MKKWLPLIIVLACAGWVLSSLRQKPETGFNSQEFGRLPVLLNGRIQPLDSVARNSLLQIRTKQSVFLKGTNADGTSSAGTNLTAIEWLMGVMMKPAAANEQKVFRIDNPELLGLLKLSENETYFSFNQLLPSYEEIHRQSSRVTGEKKEAQTRTSFEKQVVKLDRLPDALSAADDQPAASGFPQSGP